MTGDIPPQAWLMVLIALIAIGPARYVWAHISHSPSTHDITQPPEDLEWRTTGQFVKSLAILSILVCVSVFIFTAAAERFARSPEFIPVMMSAMGVVALATLIKGFRRAEVRPLIRGVSSTYDRRSQPKRYWVSMAWNAIIGAAMLGFALPAYRDANLSELRSQCNDDDEVSSQVVVISACDELITRSGSDADSLANAYLARASRIIDSKNMVMPYLTIRVQCFSIPLIITRTTIVGSSMHIKEITKMQSLILIQP